MPRIVAALFDSRANAEGALQALIGTGIARDRIALIGRESERRSPLGEFREMVSASQEEPSRELGEDLSAALNSLQLPEEDRALFREGLRRGCTLVSARVDAGSEEDAIRMLEMFDPVDLDRRSEEWQRAHADWAGPSAADLGKPLGADLTGGMGAGMTNTSAVPGAGQLTEATHDSGSADLRAAEGASSDSGVSSTTATGGRRGDERAGRPGVLEMDQRPDAALAAKASLSAEQTAGMGLNAEPDLYRRDTNRIGRVRAYTSD